MRRDCTNFPNDPFFLSAKITKAVDLMVELCDLHPSQVIPVSHVASNKPINQRYMYRVMEQLDVVAGTGPRLASRMALVVLGISKYRSSPVFGGNGRDVFRMIGRKIMLTQIDPNWVIVRNKF
jgi:hypothetical protein